MDKSVEYYNVLLYLYFTYDFKIITWEWSA